MKKIIISLVFLLPIFLTATVIPGGDVSGVWDAAGNPYYIDGDITLQSGAELEIGAGVEIIFNDFYKFEIFGRLIAIGTESDMISVTALDTNVGWHGFRFIDGNLSSLPANILAYCDFSYGYAVGTNDEDKFGGAIYCFNTSNLSIDTCTFSFNYADYDGGAVSLEAGSDVPISGCTFLNNNCGFYGASIVSYGSAPVITNCLFQGNDTTFFGAGISAWEESSIEIYNCRFIDNTGGACTAIYTVSSNVIMANLLFYNNTTLYGSGAAVGLTTSTTVASNITAVNNISPMNGGAFWLNGGTLEIHNSILWNNEPNDIGITAGTVTASYSCISDGTAGTNVINETPLFVDIDSGDLHLQATSPCIDTGDDSVVGFTLPELDLDGNARIVDGDEDGAATLDMGAYEFFVPGPETGFIAGNVTDSNGDILQNAMITAGIYTAYSDGEGYYQIEVETGDYTVNCSLEGYISAEPVAITVATSETVTVDFTLAPQTGFISGNISNLTGDFLEGAMITAGEYTVYSDADGNYLLEVPIADYTVNCSLEDYYTPDPVDISVAAGETVTVDFVLEPEVDADDPVNYCFQDKGNHPNPFNPETYIDFQIKERSHVRLEIFNSRGQRISTLVNKELVSGDHSINWNGKDDTGANVKSGIYFYKIQSEHNTSVNKMILLK